MYKIIQDDNVFLDYLMKVGNSTTKNSNSNNSNNMNDNNMMNSNSMQLQMNDSLERSTDKIFKLDKRSSSRYSPEKTQQNKNLNLPQINTKDMFMLDDNNDRSLKHGIFIYLFLEFSNTFNHSPKKSMMPTITQSFSTTNKQATSFKTTVNNSKKNGNSAYGPFLHIDYEKINKKVEINNPAVKKLLQDVDYYGPYFSHCPSCSNKNLEFFKHANNDQAINILNYIKKNKKNNLHSNNNTNQSRMSRVITLNS